MGSQHSHTQREVRRAEFSQQNIKIKTVSPPDLSQTFARSMGCIFSRTEIEDAGKRAFSSTMIDLIEEETSVPIEDVANVCVVVGNVPHLDYYKEDGNYETDELEKELIMVSNTCKKISKSSKLVFDYFHGHSSRMEAAVTALSLGGYGDLGVIYGVLNSYPSLLALKGYASMPEWQKDDITREIFSFLIDNRRIFPVLSFLMEGKYKIIYFYVLVLIVYIVMCDCC